MLKVYFYKCFGFFALSKVPLAQDGEAILLSPRINTLNKKTPSLLERFFV